MLAMLRLATPLAAANLLQMAVGAVDVMFVARLGDQALAASTLAMSLFLLLMWCFWGISGAVSPVVAAELGARAHSVREVRRSVRMGLWLGLALGLVGMAITSRFDLVMRATGQQPAVAALAAGFAQVLKWSMVPMVVSSVLRSVVATLGRPAYATAITVLSLLSNICGNYALVFGHWGAPALGLTSVVTVLAYLLVLRCDRRLRRYRLLGRWWRPEWRRLWQVLRLGAPIGLIVAAEGGLFNSAAFLMGRIGVAALAGHAVAIQIAALAFQVPFGVGQAATIRVGYHFGARDQVAIGKAGRAAMLVGLGFACTNALVMVAAPRLVISAYVDAAAPANATLVALAISYLRIAAAFQLADAVQTIAAGSLRGLQDTAVPAAIAIAGYWLGGFATALWLGLNTPLAGVGVWIGLLVGLLVVAVLLGWRWHRRAALGLLPG
jgi:MATE family multidrug resistance protein